MCVIQDYWYYTIINWPGVAGVRLVLFSAHPPPKIRQKSSYTDTEITQPRKQVNRSPKWHIEDNGHGRLCVKTYFFFTMSCFSTRGSLSGGKIAFFSNKSPKIISWKILVIHHYMWQIYLDFDLHSVYFIMQNYPVTREWDETNWLDPLVLPAPAELKCYHTSTVRPCMDTA